MADVLVVLIVASQVALYLLIAYMFCSLQRKYRGRSVSELQQALIYRQGGGPEETTGEHRIDIATRYAAGDCRKGDDQLTEVVGAVNGDFTVHSLQRRGGGSRALSGVCFCKHAAGPVLRNLWREAQVVADGESAGEEPFHGSPTACKVGAALYC
ncbi:hypothetical protein PHYPSEUDO_007986 [Phytophthora pseudosyringae]|uniref:Uncharacterized protein n=1 Tax=Phytophthora pseudosyringae TaxID=221518 RepID=A0A8T1VID5_9STRA|nr:hypothetical protein PHYPSEUDO_007986 [Phytophthora pseudosyringae]